MSLLNKMIIVIICFAVATAGFLIKIPVPLRGHDKLLHSAAYFFAAAGLNFLFRKGLLVILVALALFGVLIEQLQQVANKITHSHIHGRFDIEDIYANLKGLLLYAALALVWMALSAAFKMMTSTQQPVKSVE
jgi:hypothetical protein